MAKHREYEVGTYDRLMDTVRDAWRKEDQARVQNRDTLVKHSGPSGVGQNPLGARPSLDASYAFNMKAKALGDVQVFGRRPQKAGHAAAMKPKPRGPRAKPPRWAAQKVDYQDALSMITEEAIEKLRAKMAAQKAVPKGSPDALSPEKTNPGFRYIPGQSYYEKLTEGLRVDSGQGKDFFDPEGTQTYFGRPATW